MSFPRPSLANFVRTLLINGNTPETLNIERLARFNPWDAGAIRDEFKIQQNGSRKLPEEKAAFAPPVREEVEE